MHDELSRGCVRVQLRRATVMFSLHPRDFTTISIVFVNH